MRITVRGFYFNDAFSDLQNRDIERTAAEVINRDRLILLLIETIGQGRRRRFINDSEDLQTRNTSSIFGRLALRVIEVGWNGNDRLVDFLADVVLSRGFQLLKNHRRYFRRRIFFAADVDTRVAIAGPGDFVRHHFHLFGDFLVPAAHESLDRINRVLGIRHRLPLCHLAGQSLASLGERDHRRRRPAPFLVCDYDRLSSFHNGHNGVRGTQVDSNNLTHR